MTSRQTPVSDNRRPRSFFGGLLDPDSGRTGSPRGGIRASNIWSFCAAALPGW